MKFNDKVAPITLALVGVVLVLISWGAPVLTPILLGWFPFLASLIAHGLTIPSNPFSHLDIIADSKTGSLALMLLAPQPMMEVFRWFWNR